MNSVIKYRVLTSEDREKYRQIRLECLKNYPQNFGTLYEDEINSSSLKFDNIISQNDSADFLFGAFINEKLVGICGNIQEDRIKTRHIAEISHVYVSPDFGKKGIATNLLKLTLEKVFSNNIVEQIILGVVKSNTQAIEIYQKAGFKQYGILENYYKFNDSYETLVLMNLTRNTFSENPLI
jgi:ribosomal protein S18 acetylase RimI-like enzyme